MELSFHFAHHSPEWRVTQDRRAQQAALFKRGSRGNFAGCLRGVLSPRGFTGFRWKSGNELRLWRIPLSFSDYRRGCTLKYNQSFVWEARREKLFVWKYVYMTVLLKHRDKDENVQYCQLIKCQWTIKIVCNFYIAIFKRFFIRFCILCPV